MPKKERKKKKQKKETPEKVAEPTDSTEPPVEGKPEESKVKKEDRKRKKEKKPRKKDEPKEDVPETLDNIANNIYNALFDELITFHNNLQHMNAKTIRQTLILLDGKMLWIERLSEQDLLGQEDESEDIIDMELQMLEMGMDLETADEMKDEFSPMEMQFSLEDYKAEMEDTKSVGQELRDMLKDFQEDANPMDDLMSKFLLFDLRAMLERAVNEVFRLEGKVKKLLKKEGTEKEVKIIQADQKKIVKKQLREMLNKLKKEKPSVVFPDEKLLEYKQLTPKAIIEMKRKEEAQFDQLVNELME